MECKLLASELPGIVHHWKQGTHRILELGEPGRSYGPTLCSVPLTLLSLFWSSSHCEGLGNIFHTEDHILFWASFLLPHHSGRQGQWEKRLEQRKQIIPLQRRLVSTHTHTLLCILHLGKEEALSDFRGTFQLGKNPQGGYDAGLVGVVAWREFQDPAEGYICPYLATVGDLLIVSAFFNFPFLSISPSDAPAVKLLLKIHDTCLWTYMTVEHWWNMHSCNISLCGEAQRWWGRAGDPPIALLGKFFFLGGGCSLFQKIHILLGCKKAENSNKFSQWRIKKNKTTKLWVKTASQSFQKNN